MTRVIVIRAAARVRLCTSIRRGREINAGRYSPRQLRMTGPDAGVDDIHARGGARAAIVIQKVQSSTSIKPVEMPRRGILCGC